MENTAKSYRMESDRRMTVSDEIKDFIGHRLFGWCIEDGKPYIARFLYNEHELNFRVGGRLYSLGKNGKITVPEQIAEIIGSFRGRSFDWEIVGLRAYLRIRCDSKNDFEKKREALQRLDDRNKLRLLENEEKEKCRGRTEEIEEYERRRKAKGK